MAGKDDVRTTARPSRPRPLALREEDAPPGQYHVRSTPPRDEPVGRVALRAAIQPELSPREEMLRTMAAIEGKQLAESSDRWEAFEGRMRAELQALVVREVRSVPPPPEKHKTKFEWSHLQYVAGLIVALTGLIAIILNAQKPSAEVVKRFDANDAALAKIDKKLTDHISDEASKRESDREQDYRYKLDVRSWITDVLERASSVKIDDPPGTPAREPLGFYPAPRIDPHKVTRAHIVQPRDPYPVPPPP